MNLLSARVRGFRIVNLLALCLLLAVALAGYAFKTMVEAQAQTTAAVEDQIAGEQKRIRMLEAEIARLSAPQRIADLSRRYLSMGPPDPAREIPPEDLPAVAAAPNAVAPAAGEPAR